MMATNVNNLSTRLGAAFYAAKAAFITAAPVVVQQEVSKQPRKQYPAEVREFLMQDGISHINVDIRSRCQLGRVLSHPHDQNWTHPKYGPFYCMDGFWSYVKSGMTVDNFRYMNSAKARKCGKELVVGKPVKDFCITIVEANYFRIVQFPEIVALLKASSAPFEQYYVFSPDRDDSKALIIRTEPRDWVVLGFEYIRACVKNDVPFNIDEYKALALAKNIRLT